MPWKASSVMEEKLRFVLEYERDEQTMTELCDSYGICAGDRVRVAAAVPGGRQVGLLELNRAPRRHPNQTPAEIERRCWSCGRRTCAGDRAS